LTILAQSCPKEVVGETSSSHPVEKDDACSGDVSLDQLQIREEGREKGRKLMLMVWQMVKKDLKGLLKI